MKKSDFIKCLEAGACLTVEVGYMRFSDVLALAEATAKGKGSLTLKDTERLKDSELVCLCATAPGRIKLPDVRLED